MRVAQAATRAATPTPHSAAHDSAGLVAVPRALANLIGRDGLTAWDVAAQRARGSIGVRRVAWDGTRHCLRWSLIISNVLSVTVPELTQVVRPPAAQRASIDDGAGVAAP